MILIKLILAYFYTLKYNTNAMGLKIAIHTQLDSLVE